MTNRIVHPFYTRSIDCFFCIVTVHVVNNPLTSRDFEYDTHIVHVLECINMCYFV